MDTKCAIKNFVIIAIIALSIFVSGVIFGYIGVVANPIKYCETCDSISSSTSEYCDDCGTHFRIINTLNKAK